MAPDSPAGTAAPAARPSPRIDGIDIVRGFAVLGMFAGHVGDWGRRDVEGDGWAWLFLADGRPSATFAMLVGVSITLMLTGRSGSAPLVGPAPANPRHTRLRVLVRAAIVIGIGYALSALGTPVDVILMSFGLMFAAATLLLRLPIWVLALIAAAHLTVGPYVLHYHRADIAQQAWASWPVIEALWGYHYPAITWMAYVIAGIIVGRLALRQRRVQAALGAAGVALMTLGYVVAPLLGGRSPLPGSEPGDPALWWLSAAPHSVAGFGAYAPAEVLGNIGWTLAGLAMFIAAGTAVARWLSPVAAAGSMSLSMYAAHILAIWLIDQQSANPGSYDIVFQPSNWTLIAFWIGGLACAWAWRQWMKSGPLEIAMTVASTRMADAIAGRRFGRARAGK